MQQPEYGIISRSRDRPNLTKSASNSHVCVVVTPSLRQPCETRQYWIVLDVVERGLHVRDGRRPKFTPQASSRRIPVSACLAEPPVSHAVAVCRHAVTANSLRRIREHWVISDWLAAHASPVPVRQVEARIFPTQRADLTLQLIATTKRRSKGEIKHDDAGVSTHTSNKK